jgi:hypothetical protein
MFPNSRPEKVILMKRILGPLLVALVLAGCAAAVKVGNGTALVADRLMVPSEAAWNQIPGVHSGSNSAAVWTTEGLAIDQVNFYVGVKDGDALANNPNKEQRPLNFRAAMQGHEIVGLFEALATRDGSSYKLDKLEAVDFLGQRGWRAQFTVVRKFDDVKLSGSVWAAVRDGQLHAITFVAPALAFYPRLAPKVEQIAAAARLKS